MNNLVEEIIGCKFAIISHFLKRANMNAEDYKELRENLIKIQSIDESFRFNKNINTSLLEDVKSYVLKNNLLPAKDTGKVK